MLKNNEFDEKALLELYENYLTENGGGKFDQWMPMVEKSMETCRKLGETRNFKCLKTVYRKMTFQFHKQAKLPSATFSTLCWTPWIVLTIKTLHNVPTTATQHSVKN